MKARLGRGKQKRVPKWCSGLHIPPELPPHVQKHRVLTTMGERTWCNVVWPQECSGHMQCRVGEGDGVGWYTNTSLERQECI